MLSWLYHHLSPRLHFRSHHFRMRHAQTLLGRSITWLIDGTEQPVHSSLFAGTNFDLYSAKKKQHSVTLLLICALDRTILWLSASYGGSNTDITIAREELARFTDIFSAEEMGLGDAGFRGTPF